MSLILSMILKKGIQNMRKSYILELLCKIVYNINVVNESKKLSVSLPSSASGKVERFAAVKRELKSKELKKWLLYFYKEIHMDLTNYKIKMRDTFQFFIVTDKYINYLKNMTAMSAIIILKKELI